VNRQILRLAIPFIISNITVPLVGTVDTALMGHFGSQAHLGAIGLAGSIFNFLYWNFAFLRMSMAGFTAQAFGAGDKDESATLLGRSVCIALIGAILLVILQVPIAKLSFFISQGGADVEMYAREYFYIRIYAAPATLSLYAITGWFIGIQNARVPMITSLIVNLVNIGASAFFVIVLKMDSTGVAWGTVLAQYAGLAFVVIVMFSNHRKTIDLIRFRNLFSGGSMWRFFQVNRDVFIRTFFVIFVLTYFNFASAKQGNVILDINVIFLQLIYAFSFFIDGFANAAEALVGRFIGEQNKSGLKLAVKTLFYWGAILAGVFTISYFLFYNQLIKIYTNDSEIINRAKEYAHWIMILPLISFTAFVWDGIYLGATAAAEQRNATLISAIVFFTIFFTFKGSLGNHALLIAQLCFFALRGIIQTIYYKSAILDRFFKTGS
jgi:multidrug resistance protein, MATE family